VTTTNDGPPADHEQFSDLMGRVLALYEHQQALAELRAAYDEGVWWARQLLEEDDDLAPLQGLDGFEELVVEPVLAKLVASG
jgi:hypothetical protein